MTPSTIRDSIFAALAVLVLAAFVWLFGQPLWEGLFAREVAPKMLAEEVADPRTYVATAVAALVGGVSAVFLGAEGAQAGLRRNAWKVSDLIRIAYVVVYALFGAAAIVAWVKEGEATAVLIRNLAVTFIGLVTPAVAAYLGAKHLADEPRIPPAVQPRA